MGSIFSDNSILMTIIYVLNVIIAIIIIFVERKDPVSTLAWVGVLIFLPVLGFILYLFLAQNISRQRIFHLSKNEEYVTRKALREQITRMDSGELRLIDEAADKEDLLRLNQTYAGAYYTQDNDIDIFTDGEQLMADFAKSIANAEHEINIEFFIVKNDEIGRGMIEALTLKAREGVRVRLLMDAVGSNQIWESRLKDFKEAGGEYAFFFRNKLRVVNIKLNYRNHRKVTVIDRKTGYIGGFNIGREYLGRKKKFGYWRDTHWKIRGGAVRDLNSRFLLDWREASKENFSLHDIEYPEYDGGNTGVQIVSGGPETGKEEIKLAYMKMIASARRNVFIQTPYFVPDHSILESLKIAAQSGVDVRLMIPCMPDHMFVYSATVSYAAELIDAGCRVFIYDNGFLHAKTVTVDGEIASCGSANFDRRSFALNFEANAFAYSKEIAGRMEDIYRNDMLNCHELTKRLYETRSIWDKIKESVSRLLSTLL